MFTNVEYYVNIYLNIFIIYTYAIIMTCMYEESNIFIIEILT